MSFNILMAVIIQTAIAWDIKACHSVDRRFLCRICTHFLNYMVLHPRKSQSEYKYISILPKTSLRFMGYDGNKI
jgi:hypothetical protein